jgi:hypothetical protein
VLAVLRAFDSDRLARCQFYFGGGTRIVLDLDEYRLSRDVDFLCSSADGYSELRFAAAKEGYAALLPGAEREGLRFPREMRTDQYGIRFPVEIEGQVLRVELIREARIGLDPGTRPPWSPVDCLSLADCYAEKLLASSDRWADRQVLSRDLIDLGALRERIGPIPEGAWRKAEATYRTVVRTDLRKALDLLADEDYRRRCFEGLHVEDAEPILAGLARLRTDLEDQA